MKTLIEQVEAGQVEMDQEANYHTVDYIDHVNDVLIGHYAEGIELLFDEHEHVKELRQKIYEGELTLEAWDDFVNNELSDRFNYDKVAAYYNEDGQLVWL